MLIFATNKRSHDWNKSRDLTFQFTIYRWALFEIWPMSFLSSAVNRHGALSSPKKIINPKAQNLPWNIQILKDPIQSLWNNRRHFAERDTLISKALWIGISNFRCRESTIYAVFTTGDPTNTVFGYGTGKWGIFASIGEALQSQCREFYICGFCQVTKSWEAVTLFRALNKLLWKQKIIFCKIANMTLQNCWTHYYCREG